MTMKPSTFDLANYSEHFASDEDFVAFVKALESRLAESGCAVIVSGGRTVGVMFSVKDSLHLLVESFVYNAA